MERLNPYWTQLLDAEKGPCAAFRKASKNHNLHLIPKRAFTVESISAMDITGRTALHWIAQHEAIDQVPKHVLTEKTLLAKAIDESTPLHWCAYSGQINLIPEEVLTMRALLTTNDTGQNIFHWAAINGHINKIPEQYLTAETLSLLSNAKFTPIQVGAVHKQTSQFLGMELPEELTAALGKEWATENKRVIEAKKQLAEEVEAGQLDMY